ncbi:MAG: hypothetical protein Q7S72_00815 [Candidatus Taylorbacteria bacterium]|nr:hypothetical protein [Candidatus Taylorbacteria bacterium]
MLEFQKKKKIRRILYSPIVLIILSGLLIVLVSGVWGVYKKTQLSIENLEREKMEFEKLVIREKTLASSIDYLKTEQGIENEIRTKFRAVKEGEKVVVIIDNQASVTPTGVSTSTAGFWYKVFHWPQ